MDSEYWCHHCKQTIVPMITVDAIRCTRCNDRFVEKIEGSSRSPRAASPFADTSRLAELFSSSTRSARRGREEDQERGLGRSRDSDYWCHQCEQMIVPVITGNEIRCTRCNDRYVEQIEVSPRPLKATSPFVDQSRLAASFSSSTGFERRGTEEDQESGLGRPRDSGYWCHQCEQTIVPVITRDEIRCTRCNDRYVEQIEGSPRPPKAASTFAYPSRLAALFSGSTRFARRGTEEDQESGLGRPRDSDYWCHQCDQTIVPMITGDEIWCTHCNDRYVEQIEGSPRPPRAASPFADPSRLAALFSSSAGSARRGREEDRESGLGRPRDSDYWCHQCEQTIVPVITGDEIRCTRCNDICVEQIEGSPRPPRAASPFAEPSRLAALLSSSARSARRGRKEDQESGLGRSGDSDYWCHRCEQRIIPVITGDEIRCTRCNDIYVEQIEGSSRPPRAASPFLDPSRLGALLSSSAGSARRGREEDQESELGRRRDSDFWCHRCEQTIVPMITGDEFRCTRCNDIYVEQIEGSSRPPRAASPFLYLA